ncbi:TM2 domain-containing protein [Flavobacterium terrisoli]|uniref:TM2 domain-containing protein n=1 Tax=Flavobacterium terrisoli TaxID=3242195 RepID=UPI0025429CD9|nr:TM2 domain-containing protein [Flavobacterium buctense]
MKLKLFLSMIALLLVSGTASYASFPVQSNTSTVASVNAPAVEKNKEELSSPAAAGAGKSQIIALVLCALVGGLGIHRFYLGYTWQGIVQLLTLGGCGIWALIDLVRIITGDLGPKNGGYDKTL